MSYEIDSAQTQKIVFSTDLVIKTSSSITYSVVVTDLNFSKPGERLALVGPGSDDTVRVYFNTARRTAKIGGFPVSTTEAGAANIEITFAAGTKLELTSTKHPTLTGFWRVVECSATGNNSINTSFDLNLEYSIEQAWP